MTISERKSYSGSTKSPLSNVRGSTIVSSGVNSTSNMIMNVVREAPALSNGTTTNEYGNILLGAQAWPLIQILDLTLLIMGSLF